MNKRFWVLLTGVLACTATFAVDKELNATTDTLNIEMEEVVVTGTNIATTKNTLPFSISVINESKIEGSGDSKILSILTGQVPSLFVTERGVLGFGVSTGGSGAIKIRGVGGSPTSQVLMMVDGQPQFAGVYSHHVGDAYPSEYVEKVEVVRGPASVLYGSNAMGGAINVITKSAKKDGIYTTLSTQYGSFNTSQSSISNSIKKGRFSSLISLSYDRTDGTIKDFDFKQGSGYAKIGYKISDNWSAKLDYSLTKFIGSDPSYVSEQYPDPYKQDIVRGSTSLNVDNNYGSTSGSIKLFYSYGNHFIKDPKSFHSLDDHLGLMIYESFSLFKGNHITGGFDFTHYTGEIPMSGGISYTEGSISTMDKKEITEYAPYIVISQNIVKDKITLNAGARMVINDIFGSSFVPQGGVAIRPLSGTTVKASIAKGYRNPSFKDLYLYMIANPDLKPESMVNCEVSISQMLLNNKLSVELTAYQAKGEDLIQIVAHPELGHALNENTGEFTNSGIEFMASYSILKNLSANATYSYLNTDIENLTGAPKNQYFVGATWQFAPKFTLDAQLKHVDGLYVYKDEKVDMSDEAFTLLNAKISYKPVKCLELNLLLDNILNNKYSINYGYEMPGFMLFGGVKLNF